MKTDFKLKPLLSVLCILLAAAWIYADCGKCASKESPRQCEAKKACCATQKGVCCKKATATEQTATAPVDFTLTDINGNQVQLSKLKGKFVVLEWTNYDCPFVKPHYQPEKQTTAVLTRNMPTKMSSG